MQPEQPVKNPKLAPKGLEAFWDELAQRKLSLSDGFKKVQLLAVEPIFPEQQVADKEVEEFLNNFVFAVNQPSEERLGELINEEIGQEFNLINADFIAHDFQKRMLDWLKEKQGRYLSENTISKFFNEAREKIAQLVLIGLTSEYTKKVQEAGISFKKLPDQLQAFLKRSTLYNQQKIFNLVTSETATLLGGVKVNQALQALQADTGHYSRKGSYIFIRLDTLVRNQEQVLQAFRNAETSLLIVECKPQKESVDSLYDALSEQLTGYKNKRLLLIGPANYPLVKKFNDHFQAEKQEETDTNHFSDLTSDSQQTLLAKEVKFQGNMVALNRLIDENQENLIKEIPLAALLNQEPLAIGDELAISSGYDESYYIDRTFNHQIVIKADIFQDKSEGSDLLAVTKEEFEPLCQQYSQSNVHWLKYESDRIVWQQSQGSLATLRKYIDIDTRHTHSYPPKNLRDFLQRHKVMLISDTSGMGKSTVLTQLSKQLKQAFPTHWVVRLDLNEHTKALEDQQDSEALDSDSAIEFVSQNLLNLKPGLEQVLFEQCFKPDGKVKLVLLLDGFDEISPRYKDTVIHLLQGLRKTSLEQLWVTTRLHLKAVLEDELQQLSYTLEPFSETNQLDFLTNFWFKKWEVNKKPLKIYAKALVEKLAQSTNDKEKDFTGIPLQIRLLAESFEKEAKAFCESSDTLKLPGRLDLLGLYQRFITNKYAIWRKNKGPIAEGESDESNLYDISINKNHQQRALQVLFTQEQVNFLQPKDDLSKLSNEALSRIGIVQIIDDKPRFIHRTFAEYYAADFLVNKLKKKNQGREAQDFLLTQILLQDDYQVIRAFLNGKLAENQLLKSVLTQYGERIEELWPNDDSRNRESKPLFLHIAVEENNVKIVSFLLGSLKEGGHPATFGKLLLEKKDDSNEGEQTILHRAACRGYIGILKEVLEKLLEWDEEVGQETLLKLLLEKNLVGDTALHQVAKRGHVEVSEKLLKWGKEAGKETLLKLLLEKKPCRRHRIAPSSNGRPCI